MNKNNYLLIFLGFIFLLGIISAGQTKIIETEIQVSFAPSGNCTETCTNTTSENTTNQICTNVCPGILKITGENLLKEYVMDGENFNDILDNNVIRDLGNESDITQLVEELKSWREIEDKFNRCLDSNRNISVQLQNYEDDYGYEQNFTECKLAKENLIEDIERARTETSSLSNEVKSLQSEKFIYAVAGIVLALVFMKFILPKIKGEETPKEDTGELPPNSGY